MNEHPRNPAPPEDGGAPASRFGPAQDRYSAASEARRARIAREIRPASRFAPAASSRFGPAQPRAAGRRRAWRAPRRVVGGRWRAWLDRVRGDAVAAILLRSALVAAILALMLGIGFMLKPRLELARAARLAASGDPAQAEAYLDRLERDVHAPRRLEALREALVWRYIESAEYDAAQALIAQLPEGDAARALRREADAGRAAALYESGDYAAAAQLYYALDDYADARAQYARCRCAMAVAAWMDGDEMRARTLLMDLEGADQVVESAALKVTGDPAFVREILSTELFSPAALQQMARDEAAARAARAEIAPHRLAAGYRHTLGLNADGTVVAAGSNSDGQCEVTGWTDIVEVAAGAAHSVGLRADGTVVAAGDDSYGQCDVDGWTDIRAVAASAYGTFGLRSDGTVAATRAYADKVSGWRDVNQIAAGSYAAGGLYGQGGMASTHPGARLEPGASLYALSVCGPVSAALLPDGSLYANLAAAPAWRALKQVVASSTGLIGVFNDGGCRGFTFRDRRDVALEIDGAVVEAASSGTHHVVRTGDGRVFAFGLNGDGQCDVEAWALE